nr:MAG TPA: hypothetical protein [Caudoviricetes sp.]
MIRRLNTEQVFFLKLCIEIANHLTQEQKGITNTK